ncbi:MAG: phosphate signaling complex protein PhoU [Chloroflexi bacterium]|nr:phosphate signaling complex protein PhoU [Chloroflexota bacterium]
MSRVHFDRELQALQDRLLALGSKVAQNIVTAGNLLLQRNNATARQVIREDEHVNQEQMAIEKDSLILLATQQPLASDLRLVASVISIATELERINDYAKGIAKINLMIADEELLEPARDLPLMADKAASMLTRSLQAFVRRDVEAAYALHDEDDEVDALYNRVYEKLISLIREDVQMMDQATHLLWAAHNLERTADRVSNICERIIFTVTGKLVEMPEEEDEIPYPQD